MCCLQERPARNSVMFGGRAINLQLVAEHTGLDHGYLSRLFSPRRATSPSIEASAAIARALGMSLDGFLDAYRAKKSPPRQQQGEEQTA